MRVEKLIENWNVAIRWIHFPLHPETPPGGIDLTELFQGREAMLTTMRQRLQELAAAEGLPYGDRTRTYNSRLAQELGKWADTKPGGDALHAILFRAFFVELEDISDPDTLVRLAGQASLPQEEARQVLEDRTFRAAIDQDWTRSRALGITGVPTFVAAGRGVVGAQPYEALEQLVEAAGGVRR